MDVDAYLLEKKKARAILLKRTLYTIKIVKDILIIIILVCSIIAIWQYMSLVSDIKEGIEDTRRKFKGLYNRGSDGIRTTSCLRWSMLEDDKAGEDKTPVV